MMRGLVLAMAFVVGCGSVSADGPQKGGQCPGALPSDCSAAVPYGTGSGYVYQTCGSMVAFSTASATGVGDVVCCVQNVPAGTVPDFMSNCVVDGNLL